MNTNKPVTLFIQCIIDAVYPEVAEAMVKVLKGLGLTLSCPKDQTCCGQPAFNSGYQKEARAAAVHFLKVFKDAHVIVCPSGSCVNMVRHHYLELFDDDPDLKNLAAETAKKTFEFTEFLVDVLKVDGLGARYDGRVTYHDSCHLLRGIKVAEQPRKLIKGVKGLDFVEMHNSDRCCGFGGSFSVKYPEISAAMVDDKVNHIIATKADAVVGCDMGCLMNIKGRLSRIGSDMKVMHIAQLLAGNT